MKLAFIIALAVIAAFAQAPQHSVTLNWVDNSNPTGTTYSVYRAQGLCSGTPTYNKIASAVAVKTYQDTSVIPGNYCYTVSATVGGMESAQATPALAPVPSFPVTSLQITVQ